MWKIARALALAAILVSGVNGDREEAQVSSERLEDAREVVLVTGATGRTGSKVFELLKKTGKVQVRGLVRNQSKAQKMLNCGECTEADGIFVGDVTQYESLSAGMEGATGLVILTSAIPVRKLFRFVYPPGGYPIDVDWHGAVNQVRMALSKGIKHVVLVSTMGTTNPKSVFPGDISFYKLNGEAFLMQSRIPYSIIKPCGLTDKTFAFGSQVGHCDKFKDLTLLPMITRTRVAAMVAWAAENPEGAAYTRFDVCSDPLKPLKKDDYQKLFDKAANLDFSQCNF